VNGPENVWAVYSRLIGGTNEMDNEITAIQVVEQASWAASRLAVAADLGAKMKCEFCQGLGISNARMKSAADGVPPYCLECNGTGVADCCNGMQACQVVDNDWLAASVVRGQGTAEEGSE